MAHVFLSYAREDFPRAEGLAAAIKRAGFSVWWDRNLDGGAEYSREIDAALNTADAVVVMWSAQSIDSAWVRDEADAGRDSGRLVPVLIDSVQPPLGFRQYQSIDMSSWKGRSRSPDFRDLIKSIEVLSRGRPSPSPSPSPATHPSQTVRQPLPWTKVLVGIVALVVVAIASWFVVRNQSDRAIQTVAVSAAEPAVEPLARDLLVKLATLQSANSGSLRLLNKIPDEGKAADLLFEIGGDIRSAKPHANLVLMTGKDRTVLWSDDLSQENGNLADLKQQAAFTAAKVLGCALEGLASGHDRLSQDVLKLYLHACALLGETSFQESNSVIPVLEKVTREEPGFKPAWAKLLIAEISRYQDGGAEQRRAIAAHLRSRIAEARKIDPRMPEAYLAEAELLPAPHFYEQVTLGDQAVGAGSENPYPYYGRTLLFLGVGRMEAAIGDARRAVALDPLSPAVRHRYIEALNYAGRTEAAKSELAEAQRLWPGATTILEAQYRVDMSSGDPKEALRFLLSGKVQGSQTRESFLRAKIEPTKQNIDRAVQLGMSGYSDTGRGMGQIILILGEFDKKEEAFKILLGRQDPFEIPYFVELLFRPAQADLRADPRFMLVASRFGLVDYWQRSGDWPDFCADPDLPYNCKIEANKLPARR
jgi:tetratricopeptide (TPR) repeat protein